MKYVVLLLTLFISCQSTSDNVLQDKIKELELALSEANAKNNDETDFIHTVYFWMKDDITDAEQEEFGTEALAALTKCSSIYKVYYGPPAHTPREVVDNSYDYAWICHFRSKEDQDAYQVDPIHTKLVEDYNHLWEKVIVYDNVLQAK